MTGVTPTAATDAHSTTAIDYGYLACEYYRCIVAAFSFTPEPSTCWSVKKTHDVGFSLFVCVCVCGSRTNLWRKNRGHSCLRIGRWHPGHVLTLCVSEHAYTGVCAWIFSG